MNTFFIACASIAFSVAAQFMLKSGMVHARAAAAGAHLTSWDNLLAVVAQPAVWAGFALYGAGAIVWLRVLADWDVSRAYPLVGLGFVATAGIGVVMGEAVSLQRLAGVALICAGVYLVGRS